jgi:NosR/NirI family nitrous oxide reductase transcriptional regulator
MQSVAAPSRLADFVTSVTPQDFFPKASRFGTLQGDPPILPVYAQDELLGYVYLNSDITGAVGYSGKPVHMLVGINTDGAITGFKLVEHKEPIVLVGVPEKRVVEALNKLIGARIGPISAGKERSPQPDIVKPDIVSGATVTVLVMDEAAIADILARVKTARAYATTVEGTHEIGGAARDVAKNRGAGRID